MDKFIKASPKLTAVLIFLGYWDLHFYYKYFDIQIYDFINTGEVIVSFFPIALDVFIYCAIFFIFLGFAYFTSDSEEYDKKQNEIYEDDWKLLKKIKLLFKKDIYEGRKWYKKIIYFTLSLFEVVMRIIVLLIFTYTIYKSFVLIKYESKELYKYYFMVIIDIVILFIMLDHFIPKKLIDNYYRRNKKNIGRIVLASEFIILFLILNTVSNYKDAMKILSGKPKYNISFVYKDSLYKTDSVTVYIGKTQNYLFIRNLQNNTNQIFHSDKIENLKMVKVF
jgi:hypothetical protein